jgi:hypothetical protein
VLTVASTRSSVLKKMPLTHISPVGASLLAKAVGHSALHCQDDPIREQARSHKKSMLSPDAAR